MMIFIELCKISIQLTEVSDDERHTTLSRDCIPVLKKMRGSFVFGICDLVVGVERYTKKVNII